MKGFSCGLVLALSSTAAVALNAVPAPVPAGVEAGDHIQQQPILGDPMVAGGFDKSILEDVINASRLLSFHRALVEIESITNNEYAVGQLVIDALETLNFTVETQVVPYPDDEDSEAVVKSTKRKDRLNIFAYPTANPHPRILLTSHIDTVPPYLPYHLAYPLATGLDDPFFNRSDILISGRGTVDAKACVATQIYTAAKLLAEDPTLPLSLLFVVGEEVGGDGMRTFSSSDLYANHKSNLTHIIFGEPTESALVSGHKGMYPFTIHADGQASHSGYPWLGRSASSLILPLLARLDVLGATPASEGGFPTSPKYGNTTLNIGQIRAGVAANVLPAFASAQCLTRLASGGPIEARAIIDRAINDTVPEDLRTYISVTSDEGHGYEPVDIDADIEGFETVTVNYGTDVPHLKVAEGAKRYLYGPGSIFSAHSAHEGLKVGDLESAVDGYERLVKVGLERLEL